MSKPPRPPVLPGHARQQPTACTTSPQTSHPAALEPCPTCAALHEAGGSIVSPRVALRLLNEAVEHGHLATEDVQKSAFCKCIHAELAIVATHLGEFTAEEDTLFARMPLPLFQRILSSPNVINRLNALQIFALVERFCEGHDARSAALGVPVESDATLQFCLRPLARFCRRHWELDCACESLAGGFSPHASRRFSVELSGREVDEGAARRPASCPRSPPPAPRPGPPARPPVAPAATALPHENARRGSCPVVGAGPRQEAGLRRTSLPILAPPPAARSPHLLSASVAAGVFRIDLEAPGAGRQPPASPWAGGGELAAGPRPASPALSEEGGEAEGEPEGGDGELDLDLEAGVAPLALKAPPCSRAVPIPARRTSFDLRSP